LFSNIAFADLLLFKKKYHPEDFVSILDTILTQPINKEYFKDNKIKKINLSSFPNFNVKI